MLGFRILMDVIPLDASLVKGSHGTIPRDVKDHPVLIGKFSKRGGSSTVEATEVYDLLLERCASPNDKAD